MACGPCLQPDDSARMLNHGTTSSIHQVKLPRVSKSYDISLRISSFAYVTFSRGTEHGNKHGINETINSHVCTCTKTPYLQERTSRQGTRASNAPESTTAWASSGECLATARNTKAAAFL